MINSKFVKKCCEDYTRITNYEEAMNDKTQTWICHHILGEILTRQQLLDHDFYYNVPACMLKFVTLSEHMRLHNKCKMMSDETKSKIADSMKCKTNFKGHHHSTVTKQKISASRKNISDDTRKKLAESHKGKTHSEETKRKISEAKKCRTSNRKGVTLPADTRKKMSEAAKIRYKKKNFINSLNNNMNLVEDSANSVGFPVDLIREAYIQMFIRDENVTVQQIHDDKLWMCA